MKNLPCFIDTVTVDGIDYELICIPESFNGERFHNFYIQPAAHDYTLRDMFGIPAEQYTVEEAFDIAKANAPDYVTEFC